MLFEAIPERYNYIQYMKILRYCDAEKKSLKKFLTLLYIIEIQGMLNTKHMQNQRQSTKAEQIKDRTSGNI